MIENRYFNYMLVVLFLLIARNSYDLAPSSNIIKKVTFNEDYKYRESHLDNKSLHPEQIESKDSSDLKKEFLSLREKLKNKTLFDDIKAEIEEISLGFTDSQKRKSQAEKYYDINYDLNSNLSNEHNYDIFYQISLIFNDIDEKFVLANHLSEPEKQEFWNLSYVFIKSILPKDLIGLFSQYGDTNKVSYENILFEKIISKALFLNIWENMKLFSEKNVYDFYEFENYHYPVFKNIMIEIFRDNGKNFKPYVYEIFDFIIPHIDFKTLMSDEIKINNDLLVMREKYEHIIRDHLKTKPTMKDYSFKNSKKATPILVVSLFLIMLVSVGLFFIVRPWYIGLIFISISCLMCFGIFFGHIRYEKNKWDNKFDNINRFLVKTNLEIATNDNIFFLNEMNEFINKYYVKKIVNTNNIDEESIISIDDIVLDNKISSSS